MPNLPSPDAVIYHADCIDGTTAAAVLLSCYPTTTTYPLSHRAPEAIESILAELAEQRVVWLVDTTTRVEDVLEAGHTVVVIDHHVSEHDRINQLTAHSTRLTYIYDATESGASLTWRTLYPETTPEPPLLKYVRDGDLWLEEFPETKIVTTYLSMFRNQPADLLENFTKSADELLVAGRDISAYVDNTIERLVTLPPLTLRLGRYEVRAYNITNHESACGQRIATKTGATAVMFTVRGNKVKFSFRSLAEQSPSALGLALTLGGGGHELSAGGEMSLADFVTAVKIP